MTIAELEPTNPLDAAIQERVAAQTQARVALAALAIAHQADHAAIVRIADAEAALHELGYVDRSFLQVPQMPDDLTGDGVPRRPLHVVD